MFWRKSRGQTEMVWTFTGVLMKNEFIKYDEAGTARQEAWRKTKQLIYGCRERGLNGGRRCTAVISEGNTAIRKRTHTHKKNYILYTGLTGLPSCG